MAVINQPASHWLKTIVLLFPSLWAGCDIPFISIGLALAILGVSEDALRCLVVTQLA